MPPLSILDLSPVTTATPASQALRNSLDLARHADALGYTRYWVAEHHNLSNIASSAPDIMIGQIAAVTSNMRVGSGGVMLPNHAPLTVRGTLQGAGGVVSRPHRSRARAARRAPTRSRRSRCGAGRTSTTTTIFSSACRRLLLIENHGFPDDHPVHARCSAMPSDVALPPIFLLGSSDYSAQLAASIGVGFSFAHHFADLRCRVWRCGSIATISSRRNRSTSPTPSSRVAAVCADTDAEAERLATTARSQFRAPRQGRLSVRSKVRRRRSPSITRPADRDAHRAKPRATVRRLARDDRWRRLRPLIEATQADEIMITTMIFDHEARKHSYTLLARAFAEAA